MDDNKVSCTTIDDYISQCPADIQGMLQALRKIIREAAPEATEKISWQMPTFVLHGNLVHFAAFRKHIGFYPGASGIETFKDEMAGYKSTIGGVQLPLDKELPIDLITQIVKFRVAENIRDAQAKSKPKK